MTLEDEIIQLKTRVTVLEKMLQGVMDFKTNIRIDGHPKPVCLMVKDLSGTLEPPKPLFSVVP